MIWVYLKGWRASSCPSVPLWAIPFPPYYPRQVLLRQCLPALWPGPVPHCSLEPEELQGRSAGKGLTEVARRHVGSEKDALPLALKNIVIGWEKNYFRNRWTLLLAGSHHGLLLRSSPPLLSQSLKETHLCGHKYSCHSVPVFSCRISLSGLLLQNLTHHGILLSSRAPNSAQKPLTSNLTLSKKKSSWSQGGISLCAAFKERVWEYQVGFKVRNRKTHSLDSQEKYNWYQRKVV